MALKLESPVGRGIDFGSGSAAGNMRSANEQRLVAISIRKFYADFMSAGAGVNDKAQGLIVIDLERFRYEWLRGRCPSTDPDTAVVRLVVCGDCMCGQARKGQRRNPERCPNEMRMEK